MKFESTTGPIKRGRVVFTHKGYTISASSLMAPADIAIFDEMGRLVRESIPATAAGIARAVRIVNMEVRQAAQGAHR